MPLPGDIIEGIAEGAVDDDSFMSAKLRSELSSQLGKISRDAVFIWLKVRRGDSMVKLRILPQLLRPSKENTTVIWWSNIYINDYKRKSPGNQKLVDLGLLWMSLASYDVLRN
ncbi:unnamed protein product [Fraxinus pennsylvanica]|uniref:Uncharacterized protein n=1 Tax=Fraxinus pennsylvanica TaxID=56036 RepID=A0AAD2EBY0_9LAMI|nr:unnamed protein product [Fraxinus pennsylvanica]